MSRFRPRFSLLTVLLVMALVACGITIWQLWREVGPLRNGIALLAGVNKRLRDEVGELSIEDPSKIHAIRVRTDDPLTWKWRIWVPEAQRVRVWCRFGDVPRVGYPAQRPGLCILKPGEQWVTIRFRRDATQGSWHGDFQSPTESFSQAIEPSSRWFDLGKASRDEGVGYATQVNELTDEPFLIFRHRVVILSAGLSGGALREEIDSTFESDEPTQGFIIWLEQW